MLELRQPKVWMKVALGRSFSQPSRLNFRHTLVSASQFPNRISFELDGADELSSERTSIIGGTTSSGQLTPSRGLPPSTEERTALIPPDTFDQAKLLGCLVQDFPVT